jgi:3-hydroxy acid dehydrogenase / malonic semialdehyde reductase
MKFEWALVTGASSGIGLATAEALAAQKINLILVARREERLIELSTKLRKQFGIDVETVAGDVRDKELPEKLASLKSFTKIDVLVNNAGLARGLSKIQDGEMADWEEMIDTNVTALLRLTRAVLPNMVKNGKGHVVNLGSVSGRWVYPGGVVYCATKFAVRALSEGLRMDLFGTPIRVTNIEPGLVETEFSEVRLRDPNKAKTVYKNASPMSASDIAECITWSLSRPAHVNIQEMVVYPTAQAHVTMVHRKE